MVVMVMVDWVIFTLRDGAWLGMRGVDGEDLLLGTFCESLDRRQDSRDDEWRPELHQ